MEVHETPTRLRQGASFYGIPLAALPWLVASIVLAVVAFQLAGPWVALFVSDRWTLLGLRLALALAAGAPIALLAAPGLVYGHSIPRFALVMARALAVPRLTLWRPVAPCAPPPIPATGTHRTKDGWGADREEW